MDTNPSTLMSKIRTFFGFRQEPPRNDFRKPIWSSEDEDDEDELYARQQLDFPDALDVHREFANQLQDVFKTFGSIFGDMQTLFNEDHFDTTGTNTIDQHDYQDPENCYGSNIRDYYLKPGYNNKKVHEPKEDIDLDGKISSNEMSGLLKRNDNPSSEHPPFGGPLVSGKSYFQTIITTSIKKPDGSVETRRIIKNGDDVVEETTTTPADHGPFISNIDSTGDFKQSGHIYNQVMREFASLFKTLH